MSGERPTTTPKNIVLAKNVRALRHHLGMKQEAFAELLSARQSNVSRWESRGEEPSTLPLTNMAHLAGVSVQDFLSKPWEPPAGVDTDFAPTKSSGAGEIVEIQRLDLSVSMGPGSFIDEFVESELVKFDLGLVRAITRAPSNRLKLITGIGDSMYPTLNGGDLIMVDTTDRSLAKQDGLYWISVHGASGLKRLRPVAKDRVLIMSDNPAVTPQEVAAEDLRIEGRAIWFARGL